MVLHILLSTAQGGAILVSNLPSNSCERGIDSGQYFSRGQTLPPKVTQLAADWPSGRDWYFRPDFSFQMCGFVQVL